MLPEERFRARIADAASELGIGTYYLGFKDPDSDQIRRMYRGDQVWLTGCLECSSMELRVNIHSSSHHVPPPRSEE